MTHVRLTLAVALMLTARSGAANGRFPNAQQVVVGPGLRSDLVVLSTTFGLLVSRDAGRSFQWFCEEALFAPFQPPPASNPAVEITRNGDVLYSSSLGVHALGEACARRLVDGGEEASDDLTATPTGDVIYAIETPAGGRQWVLRADGAVSQLTRQGLGVTGVQFRTVDVAPSRPSRLYVSARTTTDLTPVLYRSDDGGATLDRLDLPAHTLGDDAYVAGVDPTDADTVWVRTLTGLRSTLLRSRNAGQDFTLTADVSEPLLGFALSDDGRTVWYGTAGGGLFRAVDGGDSFERISRIPIFCLRQHAGALWACTDWVQQPFVLGRSADGGFHFTPVLRWSSVEGPPSCASADPAFSICNAQWAPLRQRLLSLDALPTDDLDASTLDVPSGDSLPSVPMNSTPPSMTQGCGCHAPGTAQGGGPLTLLALALAAHRHRSRGPRSLWAVALLWVLLSALGVGCTDDAPLPAMDAGLRSRDVPGGVTGDGPSGVTGDGPSGVTGDGPGGVTGDGPGGSLSPSEVVQQWRSSPPHGVPDVANLTASVCHYFCHWADHCGDIGRFGDRSGCPAWCADQYARGFQINLSCYAARCSAREACLGAAPAPTTPLPVVPACRELCRHATSCPALMLLNLPLEENACTLVCSGQAIAVPSFGASVSCLAAASERCDVDAMMACLPNGDVFCSGVCEEMTRGCSALFPDKPTCYRRCSALPPAGSFRARQCFQLYECGMTESCLSTPVPPACLAWADAMLSRCGLGVWPPQRDLLAVACALPPIVDELDAPDNRLACLESAPLVRCRTPPETEPHACTYVPPLACTRICSAVARCPSSMLNFDCEGRCVQKFWRHERSRMGDVLACLAEANCDESLMQQCWLLQHNQPFCDRYCAFSSVCDRSTSFADCRTACSAALQAGDTSRIATLSCATPMDCASLQTCSRRATLPVDPVCRTACDGVRGNCHHVVVSLDTGEAACQAVCTDILARHGRTGDLAYANCMVGDLDHECRPLNAVSCP